MRFQIQTPVTSTPSSSNIEVRRDMLRIIRRPI